MVQGLLGKAFFSWIVRGFWGLLGRDVTSYRTRCVCLAMVVAIAGHDIEGDMARVWLGLKMHKSK